MLKGEIISKLRLCSVQEPISPGLVSLEKPSTNFESQELLVWQVSSPSFVMPSEFEYQVNVGV